MTQRLSVLDLFPVVSGKAPSLSLHDSVRLAERVDALGYERYWIAEHHNMPGIASAAPEVLIAHVAARTQRMRVGSGGIMIQNHTPLRVVEIFRTLEALHPGRIDLGLGRAPGTDPITASALRRSSGEVNEQLVELLAFATGDFPHGHPFSGIVAMPSDVQVPPIWMLGSTQAGASLAARYGLPYAFAGHFAMDEAGAALQLYRSRFTASRHSEAPYAILALSIVCAETDERAKELALPLLVAFARMSKGRPGPFPTVEEAREHRFSHEELAFIERFTSGMIVGSPARVKADLDNVISVLRPDEIMVSTVIGDLEERARSYELVGGLYGLGGT